MTARARIRPLFCLPVHDSCFLQPAFQEGGSGVSWEEIQLVLSVPGILNWSSGVYLRPRGMQPNTPDSPHRRCSLRKRAGLLYPKSIHHWLWASLGWREVVNNFLGILGWRDSHWLRVGFRRGAQPSRQQPACVGAGARRPCL